MACAGRSLLCSATRARAPVTRALARPWSGFLLLPKRVSPNRCLPVRCPRKCYYYLFYHRVWSISATRRRQMQRMCTSTPSCRPRAATSQVEKPTSSGRRPGASPPFFFPVGGYTNAAAPPRPHPARRTPERLSPPAWAAGGCGRSGVVNGAGVCSCAAASPARGARRRRHGRGAAPAGSPHPFTPHSTPGASLPPHLRIPCIFVCALVAIVVVPPRAPPTPPRPRAPALTPRRSAPATRRAPAGPRTRGRRRSRRRRRNRTRPPHPLPPHPHQPPRQCAAARPA